MEFKTKKLLTVPLLKLVENEPRHVKITSAMFVGKQITARSGADPSAKKKEPATLFNAVNLEDGTECQIIVSAVVKGVLADEYPNDTYVGKCFSITKLPRKEGKDYNGFKVVEIEDPADTPKSTKGGK